MKYLKHFEGFREKQSNIDELLDKISQYGIESLTDYELQILNNGGEDVNKLGEEYDELEKRIMHYINDGFAISIYVDDIEKFFDILNKNGIKTERNIEWVKWGDTFYFVLTSDGLKHDTKAPYQMEVYIPSFPKKPGDEDKPMEWET